MNNRETARRPDFSQRSFSIVVGFFILASCAFLGYVGGIFHAQSLHRFIIPWPVSILTYLRLWWTAPLGVVGMLFLILKDATLQPRRSACINTVVFFVALAMLAICTYFLVFRMYEVVDARHAEQKPSENRQDAEDPPADERSYTPPKAVFITPSTAGDHGLDLTIDEVTRGLMQVRLFGPTNVAFQVNDTNGQPICTSKVNAEHGHYNIDIQKEHLGHCSFIYPYPIPIGGTEVHIVRLVDSQGQEMGAD